MILALPILAGGVAVVLLLVLLTNPTWQRALRDTLAGLPVLGGWLAENSTRLQLFLFARVAVWANSAAGVLVGWLEGAQSLVSSATSQLENLASAAHENAVYLRQQVIPAAIRQAEDYGDRRLAAARAYLVAQLVLTQALARRLTAQAIARADLEHNQALAYARALWSSATGYARSLTTLALGYALALFRVSRLETAAAEQRAENYTRAGVAQAQEFTAEAYKAAVDYAAAAAGVAENYARNLTLEAEKRATLENARTLAWSAAAAGALAVAIEAIERSPCMQRCSTLGQLGAELETLDLLALVAFLTEAAKDPAGFAREFEAEFGPVIQEVRGALAGLGGPPLAA